MLIILSSLCSEQWVGLDPTNPKVDPVVHPSCLHLRLLMSIILSSLCFLQWVGLDPTNPKVGQV